MCVNEAALCGRRHFKHNERTMFSWFIGFSEEEEETRVEEFESATSRSSHMHCNSAVVNKLDKHSTVRKTSKVRSNCKRPRNAVLPDVKDCYGETSSLDSIPTICE